MQNELPNPRAYNTHHIHIPTLDDNLLYSYLETYHTLPKSKINIAYLNFNYTNTVQRLCFGYSLNYPHCIRLEHIHDTLDRGLILGLNDVSQLKNPEIIKNVPYNNYSHIIKPFINQSLSGNNHTRCLEILCESDLIYVYGTSIGVTDRVWWREVARIVSRDSKKLTISHYDETYEKSTSKRIQQEQKDAVIAKLLKAADWKEFDTGTRNRIHVLHNESVFDSLSGVMETVKIPSTI